VFHARKVEHGVGFVYDVYSTLRIRCPSCESKTCASKGQVLDDSEGGLDK
jgi:hypothetical protein